MLETHRSEQSKHSAPGIPGFWAATFCVGPLLVHVFVVFCLFFFRDQVAIGLGSKP